MRKTTKRIIAFSMAVLLGLDLLPSNVNTAQAVKRVSVSISKSKVSASKDAAHIEITAANGAKRIYVIMYGQYPEE